MKKFLIGLTLASLLVVPISVAGQIVPEYGPEDTGKPPQVAGQPGSQTAPSWDDINVLNVVESVTNWLFAILLIAAAIFIIIAGYYFVTASGDPDKVAKARNFVLYALIGVLVGFLAKGLVYLVDLVVRGSA